MPDPTTIRLTEQQEAQIKRIANETGNSVSSVVRALITEALAARNRTDQEP
jgi:Arc/MetJ-type ribon-helix-helix transcriptional regulator